MTDFKNIFLDWVTLVVMTNCKHPSSETCKFKGCVPSFFTVWFHVNLARLTGDKQKIIRPDMSQIRADFRRCLVSFFSGDRDSTNLESTVYLSRKILKSELAAIGIRIACLAISGRSRQPHVRPTEKSPRPQMNVPRNVIITLTTIITIIITGEFMKFHIFELPLQCVIQQYY